MHPFFNKIIRAFSPENPVLNPVGYPEKLFSLSGSDVMIDDRAALQLSVIYSAIRIPAEDLASLPLGVFQKQRGYYEPVTEHPLTYLFQVKPSSQQTAFSWKESVTASVAARGNSFTRIVQNRGEITALEYMDDTKWDCEVVDGRNGERVLRYYEISDPKNRLLSNEVIHIPFTAFNGSSKSLSPIDWLKKSVSLNINSVDYARSLMKQGAFSSGFVEHQGELSDEAGKRLTASLQREYAGVSNAGKLILLEEGMKFKPANISPADAEYIASRKFEIEDLLRPFRVPAHMINHLEKATFNNVSELALEYVNYCLRPWCSRWESELQCKLLSRDEYESGLRIKYNLRELLRGDIDSQTKYLKEMVMAGIMTREEARDNLGLKFKEGTDELLVPVNIFDKKTKDDES